MSGASDKGLTLREVNLLPDHVALPAGILFFLGEYRLEAAAEAPAPKRAPGIKPATFESRLSTVIDDILGPSEVQQVKVEMATGADEKGAFQLALRLEPTVDKDVMSKRLMGLSEYAMRWAKKYANTLHWEQDDRYTEMEAVDWNVAVQVVRNGKPITGMLFRAESIYRTVLDENWCAKRVDNPHGPYQGIWAAGRFLRSIAVYTGMWAADMRDGRVSDVAAPDEQVLLALDALTDGYYSDWYMEQRRAEVAQTMEPIIIEAKRPQHNPHPNREAVVGGAQRLRRVLTGTSELRV